MEIELSICGTISGSIVKATMRHDGAIRYAGQTYKTPSAAAACGVNRNGWSFWEYERYPGEWVSIDAMRK